MSDRKNLISDFEYAVRKAHAEGWDFVDLTTENGFEILDMLKEQEPRLLTLEEVLACSPRTEWLWFEEPACTSVKAKGFAMVCAQISDIGDYFVSAAVPNEWYDDVLEFYSVNYGKTWRCWSARPTDEQREAVKWND